MDPISDRVNILHLSDVHLAKSKEYDAGIVLGALRKDLEALSRTQLHPHIAVFSGDLANDGDDPDAYSLALSMVVEVLLQATGIPEENFFLVPGNHDVQRSAYLAERGAFDNLDICLDNRERLNEFITDAASRELVARKFENFNGLAGLFAHDGCLYDDFFSQAYRINGVPFSIVLTNTAWMSTAGIGRQDMGNLLVAERSLHQAISSSGTGKRILIGHHPIAWLREHSATDVQSLIDEQITVYLHGHMHKADPRAIQAALGRTYVNQGGALFTSRKMWNGYSIVSLSLASDHVQTSFRTYFDSRKSFGVGEEVSPRGVYHSSPDARSFWDNHPERLNKTLIFEWNKTALLPLLREEFNFRIYDKSLADVFVEPTLSTSPSRRQASLAEQRKGLVSIDAVCSSPDNYLISSALEFGRTTCLKYLAMRTAETCRIERIQIPAYINFEEVGVGNRRLLQAIRAALPDLPDGVGLELLLDLGCLTILVDDINPEDQRRFRQLTTFFTKYPKNKYIVCLHSQFEELLTELSPEFPFKFVKLFIYPFSRNQVRRLVEKWTGAEGENIERLLNRIIADIVHINVPVTAVTCSIFLTILDRNIDFKPVNRAVVVQQYVDALLGRYALDQAFRDTFDATNKAHYLAYVADAMVRADSYALSREQLREITKKYMDEFAFDRRSDDIIDLFLRARVLIDADSGIQFRFRAFLEYFTALRMEDDHNFYKFVMDEGRYLSFTNEIEYYSGVTRDDSVLLGLIADRFTQLNERIRQLGEWQPDINMIERFRIQKNSTDNIAADVERSLSLPRLTDEQRDEVLEGEIPRDLGRRQQVFRPVFRHDGSRWLACLGLYSRVIRNSELVRADEKRAGVFAAIVGWSELCVMIIGIAPLLAKKRKVVINGVSYVLAGSLNDEDDEKLLIRLLYAIPDNISRMIFLALGSEKLSKTLSESLWVEDGGEEPLIVTFFRKLLIADLKLGKYEEILKDLSSELNTSQFLQQVLLSRIRFMFRVGTIREQKMLRPVLVQLLRHLLPGSPSEKARSLSQQLDNLKRDGLLLRYADHDIAP